MSVLSEGSKKVNMTMKKLPETYAKYILERYLHYPELELAERPDLQNKEESLGVEVTQCDFCELEGMFRRIASGDTSRKAKKIKDKLRNRFYEDKKMYLTKVLPNDRQKLETCKSFYVGEIARVMRAKAFALVTSGSYSIESIKNILKRAVERKTEKLKNYEKFEQNELFIFCSAFCIDDMGIFPYHKNDVSQIHDLFKSSVFIGNVHFNVIHVMINSLNSEFQSVFSFTCDDVKYHRISCSDFSASAYFESQGLKYPLNPHLFTLQIEDINQQVDHDLFEFLDSKYPIEGCKWMQAVSL